MTDRIKHHISSWFLQTWYAHPPLPLSWPSHCLLSLGTRLYAAGLRHHQHQSRRGRRGLPAFVISVGNLVVGGTGKTPFSLWLTKYLRGLGWNPAILSRGYKRKDEGIAMVPSMGESLQGVLEFGDEPVLMAHKAKPASVWVGKDRWSSGNLAIQRGGANTLILDDGFQHLALKRNLDLVLLDALSPFGNGSLLPLGPLREPSTHLGRADAIVLTRAQNPERTMDTRSKITGWFPEKPVFSCIHRLTGLSAGFDGQCIPIEAIRGKKIIAFAGIGRPDSFFHLLQKAGVVLSRTIPFPDHHLYEKADILKLLNAMKESNTPFLVTTEKDMVRLSPEFQKFTLAAVLEIDFLSEHQAFCDFLRDRLPSR